MKSLADQVAKIQQDRTFLRSGISSILSVSRDVPGSLKDSTRKILQGMLEKTADEEDSK